MSTLFSSYKLLDLPWLTELTLNERRTMDTVARSFLNHSTTMIEEIQTALHQNSVSRLYEAVRKTGPVAAMFTRNDFSYGFLAMSNESDNHLSMYTIQKTNSIILELETLQSEVSYYLYYETGQSKDNHLE